MSYQKRVPKSTPDGAALILDGLIARLRRIVNVIEEAVREFREIMDSLCTHCGVCCKKQAVFLTDVEAPIIAQALVELGGTVLAKKHLSINSTVFNLWHRYVLNFDDHCPFHIDNQCLIYSKKPLTCQLFPINLIGFIDQPGSGLRTAYFEVERPLESYACGGSCDEMIRVSRSVHEKRPESVNDILQFFVSTYLDERALGYLFGQTRKRGKDAATVSSSTPTAREITFAILQQYGSQFDDPGEMPDEFLDYSKSISDEDIVRLTSVAANRNSERVTSTRINRLRRLKPEIIEHWLQNHLSTTGGTVT